MSKTRTENAFRGHRCADPKNRRLRSLALTTLIFVCAAQLLMIAGCHRGFYRRQADAEAKRLIQQKTAARWDSATGDIEIDPMSRMFDPFSADHPPIPPDDPASHKLMHEVDCKPGYPHWHANGNIDSVESPDWRAYLPVNEDGEVVLSLSEAYRLALIHSTDLQQQRETLYLSALEVSIQRFGFDSQLFAGFNSFLTSRGRFQGAGGSSTTLESSLGSTGGGITARRLGITGANFVVGLANTILWEFAGNNTQSANSLINFSLIQPLLRGAGRARIMESLTQAERTLLANVRQLERFRRGFYLEIATGRNSGAGPSQNSSAFLNAPGLSGSNVGGYLGLLQQRQRIKNIEFSVAQFESLVIQFRELFDLGRINALQVTQFETAVYGQQQLLLNAKIAYQNALDRFKVLIGIPPDVNIVIEDTFLDRFNLIDDRFPERLASVKRLREDAGAPLVGFRAKIRQQEKIAEDGGDLRAGDQSLSQQSKDVLSLLQRASKTVTAVMSEDKAAVEKDINVLDSKRKARLEYLAKVKEGIDSGRILSQVEPDVFLPKSIPTKEKLTFQLDGESNKRSLIVQLQDIETLIKEIIAELDKFEKTPNKDLEYYKDLESKVAIVPDLLTEVDGIVLELALLQAAARANSIEVTNINIDSDTAFETARCLRRDWMNARASLVDRWRQIEFFADQLESQVDLVLTGEIGNANADNPFRIRYEDGNLRAGFRFDAPIVRQAERNAYRQSQISYQQARRSFYQFEDSINQNLRVTLRTIDQNKVLFELNRRTVQVNIDRVKQARSDLSAPPRIGQSGNINPTTAQFLAQAITGLANQQDQYLQLWAQYEVLRRNLDFDMGTMQLDENFEWVDPGEIDATIGARVAMLEGVAENDRFCCGMQQSQMFAEGESYEVIETSDEEGGSGVVESPATEDAPSLEFESTPESGIDQPAEKVDTRPSIEIEKPVPDSENEGLNLPPLGGKSRLKTQRSRSLVASTSSSSRAGILNPFRKSNSMKPTGPTQKSVVVAAKTRSGEAGFVENPNLKRVFSGDQAPDTTPTEKSSANPIQLDAKIIKR